MKKYTIQVDCVNGKTYDIDIEANNEIEAIKTLVKNEFIVNNYNNLVCMINSKNIVYAEVRK